MVVAAAVASVAEEAAEVSAEAEEVADAVAAEEAVADSAAVAGAAASGGEEEMMLYIKVKNTILVTCRVWVIRFKWEIV